MWIFGCFHPSLFDPPHLTLKLKKNKTKEKHCVSTKQSDSTVEKLVHLVCCVCRETSSSLRVKEDA